MALEGYASVTSVAQGENISFHASQDTLGTIQIEIFEAIRGRNALVTATAPVGPNVTPEDAYELGCGWPPCYTLSVPLHWPSGLYYARLSTGQSSSSGTSILFVVKSTNPGSASPVLFQFSTTTYQAYNSWGGKSLYRSDSADRSRKVSFDRPGGIDYTRETGFLIWLRENGIPVECCTSLDIHEDALLLSHYQLLLSVGHDEYWSKEMRDQVEAFIGNGGNVAFFSGNVCWWQVRFENHNRTMVCYKSALEDPLSGVDNSRVSVNWYSEPVSRPENYLTGVSYRNGGGIWRTCKSSMRLKAFQVCHSKHWVFEGTGLGDGDLFGAEQEIVGYETDAADYRLGPNGNMQLTGRDGTPPSFIILATADLRDWGPCGKAGRATLGIFRRTGTVFTAATTDWVSGLLASTGVVPRITRNVIDRLKLPCPGSRWEAIGDTTDLATMTGRGGRLFAATKSRELHWCDPASQPVHWQAISDVPDIVAMAAGENSSAQSGQALFATTRSGELLRRDSVTCDTKWETIGESFDIVALAVSDGYLFAVTLDNKFLWRKMSPGAFWACIGEIGDVVTMTGSEDGLFAATSDRKLWWWQLPGPQSEPAEVLWKPIGEVPPGIISLAEQGGKLFAATQDKVIWWRDTVPGLHDQSSNRAQSETETLAVGIPSVSELSIKTAGRC